MDISRIKSKTNEYTGLYIIISYVNIKTCKTIGCILAGFLIAFRWKTYPTHFAYVATGSFKLLRLIHDKFSIIKTKPYINSIIKMYNRF